MLGKEKVENMNVAKAYSQNCSDFGGWVLGGVCRADNGKAT